MNETSAEPKLNVASSPHWRDGSTLTRTQMLWLVALLPVMIASVAHFGMMALRVLALAVGASVALDALCNRFLPSRDHTSNWSSVTLGVLLALLLPVDSPWWLVLVGCLLTIVFGKKLFGGWGGYPVHPVALGYAMLTVSWPNRLDYTASLLGSTWDVTMVDPLRLVKTMGAAGEASFHKLNLLMGYQVGGVGSSLVLWLAVGGMFLIMVHQVPWQIPGGFLAGVALCAGLLLLIDPGRTAGPGFHLLAGSTALMAFFLMPEHTTSPVNPWPMLIYGLLGGVLLVLIRAYSTHVDGSIFALLLVNICSPLLDRITPKIKGLGVVEDA